MGSRHACGLRGSKAAKRLQIKKRSSPEELAEIRAKEAHAKRNLRLYSSLVLGNLSAVVWEFEVKGADPNACLTQHKTRPFHAACEGGHLPVVQYLLTQQNCDTSATVDKTNRSGDDVKSTGWDIAIMWGRVKLHELLLTLAADHDGLKSEHARQKHRQAEVMTNAEDTDKILYYHTDPQVNQLYFQHWTKLIHVYPGNHLNESHGGDSSPVMLT